MGGCKSKVEDALDDESLREALDVESVEYGEFLELLLDDPLVVGDLKCKFAQL
jgi:hypothetical protein